MANMVFITMQFFAEDELGQSAGPDLFRNQEEITLCDRIVQLDDCSWFGLRSQGLWRSTRPKKSDRVVHRSS